MALNNLPYGVQIEDSTDLHSFDAPVDSGQATGHVLDDRCWCKPQISVTADGREIRHRVQEPDASS